VTDPPNDSTCTRESTTNGRWLQSKKDIPTCRNGAIIELAPDGSAARVIPLTCKAWHCPYCGPRLRRIWAARIAAACPQRFLTLTCDPARFKDQETAWPAMKHAFNRLVTLIRTAGYAFEYVATWELTHAGWPHVHVLQRGDYVPQSKVRAWWIHLGVGSIVHIEAVADHALAAAYVAKYLAKALDSSVRWPRHVRTISKSKHFFPPIPPPTAQAKANPWTQVLWRGSLAELLERLWRLFKLEVDATSAVTSIYLTRPSGPMDDWAHEECLEYLRGRQRPP